ncbi:translesion DNA synthesis-associated protein ImuA [Zhongshania sp.]|jgi:protein ImuA|uniref:translesion DNA synthesis-associated protein ImuA n=1 Tax=Zhongshania sp. TaxID=1971902 RepID=UPI0039E2C153
MKTHSLDQLLDERKLWRGQQLRPRLAAGDRLCTGFRALDAALHIGGWPRSGSTELLGDYGIGELWLLMPALRERLEDRAMAWLNPPFLPYTPALAEQGLAVNRQLLVRPKTLSDQLWAAEELLRSGAYAAVLSWFSGADLNDGQLRRLHIAALEGQCWHINFRPSAFAQQISPAPLRLQLAAANQALQINVIKQQGGHAGQQLQLVRPPALFLQQSAAASWPVYNTAPTPPSQRQALRKISLLSKTGKAAIFAAPQQDEVTKLATTGSKEQSR